MIKRAADDSASSRALDDVRGFVYTTHGMCTDFEMMGIEGDGGREGGGQTIIEEDFESAYEGKWAKWYERVYAKHGGKKGGW